MAVSLLPPRGSERIYVALEPIGVMAITCCAFPILFLSRAGSLPLVCPPDWCANRVALRSLITVTSNYGYRRGRLGRSSMGLTVAALGAGGFRRMRRCGELGPALMPMQPHAGRAEALRRAMLGACLGNNGFYWREEGESDSRLA